MRDRPALLDYVAIRLRGAALQYLDQGGSGLSLSPVLRPELILAPLHGPECVVGGLPEQLEWWNRSWAHGEGSG